MLWKNFVRNDVVEKQRATRRNYDPLWVLVFIVYYTFCIVHFLLLYLCECIFQGYENKVFLVLESNQFGRCGRTLLWISDHILDRALLSLPSPSSGYGRRKREEGSSNNWFYFGTAPNVPIDLLPAPVYSIGETQYNNCPSSIIFLVELLEEKRLFGLGIYCPKFNAKFQNSMAIREKSHFSITQPFFFSKFNVSQISQHLYVSMQQQDVICNKKFCWLVNWLGNCSKFFQEMAGIGISLDTAEIQKVHSIEEVLCKKMEIFYGSDLEYSLFSFLCLRFKQNTVPRANLKNDKETNSRRRRFFFFLFGGKRGGSEQNRGNGKNGSEYQGKSGEFQNSSKNKKKKTLFSLKKIFQLFFSIQISGIDPFDTKKMITLKKLSEMKCHNIFLTYAKAMEKKEFVLHFPLVYPFFWKREKEVKYPQPQKSRVFIVFVVRIQSKRKMIMNCHLVLLMNGTLLRILLYGFLTTKKKGGFLIELNLERKNLVFGIDSKQELDCVMIIGEKNTYQKGMILSGADRVEKQSAKIQSSKKFRQKILYKNFKEIEFIKSSFRTPIMNNENLKWKEKDLMIEKFRINRINGFFDTVIKKFLPPVVFIFRICDKNSESIESTDFLTVIKKAISRSLIIFPYLSYTHACYFWGKLILNNLKNSRRFFFPHPAGTSFMKKLSFLKTHFFAMCRNRVEYFEYYSYIVNERRRTLYPHRSLSRFDFTSCTSSGFSLFFFLGKKFWKQKKDPPNYENLERQKLEREKEKIYENFFLKKLLLFLTHANSQNILTSQNRLNEISKIIPQWEYQLITDEDDMQTEEDNFEIRRREAKRVIIFTDIKETKGDEDDSEDLTMIRYLEQPDFDRDLINGSVRAQRRKVVIWKVFQGNAHSPLFVYRIKNPVLVSLKSNILDMFKSIKSIFRTIVESTNEQTKIEESGIEKEKKNIRDEGRQMKIAARWETHTYGQTTNNKILFVATSFFFEKIYSISFVDNCKKSWTYIPTSTSGMVGGFSGIKKRDAYYMYLKWHFIIRRPRISRKLVDRRSSDQNNISFPFETLAKSPILCNRNSKGGCFFFNSFWTGSERTFRFAPKRTFLLETRFKRTGKKGGKNEKELFQRKKKILAKVSKENPTQLREVEIYESNEIQEEKDSIISNQIINQSFSQTRSPGLPNSSLTGKKIKDLTEQIGTIRNQIEKNINKKRKNNMGPNKSSSNAKSLEKWKILIKRRTIRLISKFPLYLKFFIELIYRHIFLYIERIYRHLFLSSIELKLARVLMRKAEKNGKYEKKEELFDKFLNFPFIRNFSLNKYIGIYFYISNEYIGICFYLALNGNEQGYVNIVHILILVLGEQKKLLINPKTKLRKNQFPLKSPLITLGILKAIYIFFLTYRACHKHMYFTNYHKSKLVICINKDLFFNIKESLCFLSPKKRILWKNKEKFIPNENEMIRNLRIMSKMNGKTGKEGIIHTIYRRPDGLDKCPKNGEILPVSLVKIKRKNKENAIHMKLKQTEKVIQKKNRKYTNWRKRIKKKIFKNIIDMIFKQINFLTPKNSRKKFMDLRFKEIRTENFLVTRTRIDFMIFRKPPQFIWKILYRRQKTDISSITTGANKNQNMQRKTHNYLKISISNAYLNISYFRLPDNLLKFHNVFVDWMGMNEKMLNYSISNLEGWFFPEFVLFHQAYKMKPWFRPNKLLLLNLNRNLNRNEKKKSKLKKKTRKSRRNHKRKRFWIYSVTTKIKRRKSGKIRHEKEKKSTRFLPRTLFTFSMQMAERYFGRKIEEESRDILSPAETDRSKKDYSIFNSNKRNGFGYNDDSSESNLCRIAQEGNIDSRTHSSVWKKRWTIFNVSNHKYFIDRKEKVPNKKKIPKRKISLKESFLFPYSWKYFIVETSEKIENSNFIQFKVSKGGKEKSSILEPKEQQPNFAREERSKYRRKSFNEIKALSLAKLSIRRFILYESVLVKCKQWQSFRYVKDTSISTIENSWIITLYPYIIYFYDIWVYENMKKYRVSKRNMWTTHFSLPFH
uniref:Protein TIC 214 n=1 Tax=Plantago ovata TaxID=185002 RepID=A0A4P8JNB5_PLAOV|nr:hypothetical chloroplast RF19 [Plantago ovata]